MKELLSLILVCFSFTLFAQEVAYVYHNNLFNDGEGYEIANIKGQGTTWEWFGRSLRFSNSSETANANQEYPECEEWIVLGPFDLSVASNPVFQSTINIEYGGSAISLHASNDFSGVVPGATIMPGSWTEILSKEEVVATVGADAQIQGNLSGFIGERSVYVAIKYETPTSAIVNTNVIKELTVLRDVSEGLEEILPQVSIVRSNEGSDFFNLSANPSLTNKWSIRSGYAKSPTLGDVWLIMKPFDLTSAADAFFSFDSRLFNGTSGPAGLQIKIYRGIYTEGTLVNDLIWEDYPITRADHRINPPDYFSSGKLDLFEYCGDNITIAFRYVNSKGEQSQIANFKMFHLPDAVAPMFTDLSINRLAYNKVVFHVNASEAAELYYGIYPESATNPSFEELKSGSNSILSDTVLYLKRASDTTYAINGLSPETSYKLMVGMEDGSSNQSELRELPFLTPALDIDPPSFGVDFTNVENNSLHVKITPSELCTYFYLFRESDLGAVTEEQIKEDGKKIDFSLEAKDIDFYNLDKNTNYSLFILGTDVAGNLSTIYEHRVLTGNTDLTSPIFSSFSIVNVGNDNLNIKVNLNEISTWYYAVQPGGEIPPDVRGVLSGARAVKAGTAEYISADNDQTFLIDGLAHNKDYIVYFMARDESNNSSDIQLIEFTTTQEGIPIISKKSEDRINIDIETSFKVTFDLFSYSGIASVDDHSLIVKQGDHYSVEGITITPIDDYAGRIIVPVYIIKDGIESNIIELEIIVAQERLEAYFTDIREVMTGTNLQAVDDKDASIALLEWQADGSFFDKLSPLSPDYSDYMTKVLGGRLVNIAKQYHDDKFRRRKRIEVRHKLYKSLEFWLDNRPEWSQEKTAAFWPNYMGAIVLVLYNDMEEEYVEEEEMKETIERLKTKIVEFNKWCWNDPEEVDAFQSLQGSNLSSRLWGSLALSAFTNSVEDAYIIFDAVNAEISYKLNDEFNHPAGWKADGSFHMNNQSGGQWNWYTYGSGWISSMLQYSEAVRRTPWNLSKDKFQLMGEVMINGAQWLNWLDFIPYNLTGKFATISGPRSNKSLFLSLINEVRYESFINNVNLDKNKELLNAYSRIDQEFTYIDSSKYFWNSNIMLHGNGFYNISLNMPSVRTGTPEAGLDSLYGIVNHHMGDGTALIFNSEMTYRRRLLWNYKKLPGTTIEQNKRSLPLNIGGNNGQSLNHFAGGLSDGNEGVASFYYDKLGPGNVNGYKSYFFFEEGMVALGAGLNKKSQNKVYEVLTTLDQDRLLSDVKYQGSGDQISKISLSTEDFEKEVLMTQPLWIHHNNNGYIIYPQQGGDLAKLSVGFQKGSWDEINGTWRLQQDNPNYIMRYDSAVVLNIAVNHLKDLKNAKYAYMVFPSRSENVFKEMVANNPIEIVQNNEKAQVVRHISNKSAGIVFMQADTVEITSELSIAVDKPVTMLIRENSNNEIEAWLSDPFQKESTVDVRFILRKLNEMPVNVQRIVVLPGGVYKGKAAYTTTGDVWTMLPPLPNDEEISEEVDITEITNDTLKIEGNLIEEDGTLEIFPSLLNKSEMLNINYQVLESETRINIEVSDLSGRLVWKKSERNNEGYYKTQINSTGFESDIYIVNVKVGNKSWTRRIIIQ